MGKNHPFTERLRFLNRTMPSVYETFQKGIENETLKYVQML